MKRRDVSYANRLVGLCELQVIGVILRLLITMREDLWIVEIQLLIPLTIPSRKICPFPSCVV